MRNKAFGPRGRLVARRKPPFWPPIWSILPILSHGDAGFSIATIEPAPSWLCPASTGMPSARGPRSQAAALLYGIIRSPPKLSSVGESVDFYVLSPRRISVEQSGAIGLGRHALRRPKSHRPAGLTAVRPRDHRGLHVARFIRFLLSRSTLREHGLQGKKMPNQALTY